MELWKLNNVSTSLFFLFFLFFLWEDGKVENSFLFLFFFLFLRKDGKVEDSPDREETGGGKGEENIAINVVVNLRIRKKNS